MKKIVLGALLFGVVAASQAKLVAKWTFDEGSGTAISDSVETNAAYEGTINGSPLFSTNTHDGTGYALDFVGGTNANWVAFGPDVFSNISNEVSLAFWAYGNTNQPQGQIAFQATPGRTLQSHLPWSNGTVYWDAGDRMSFSASVSLYKTNWTYWVMTKNATTGDQKVYANGQLLSSASGKTNNVSGITAFSIGAETTGGLTYYGLIDDFAVYDHEMTLEEIAIGYDPYIISPVIEQSASVGESPFEVVFDATGTVAGQGVADYLWDFDGDGINDASGGVVTNTFVAEGSHSVTLWVVDGASASNTVSTTVLVDSPTWSTNLPAMTYIRENWNTTNYPTASSNDLAQSVYLTNTLYSQSAILTNDWPYLLDGGVGTADDIGSSGYTRMYAGDWFEVQFDTSSAPFGYDLSQIRTIAGWGVEAGGRANQGYDVIVTYMDDSTETIAGWTYWNPNVPTTYWTGVTLESEAGGAFVSGVKAVKIQITKAAVPGGWLLFREFDFEGSATVIVDGPTVSQSIVSNHVVLSWESVQGGLYGVQSTDALTGTWGDEDAGIVATPPMNTYTTAVDAASTAFFRVELENANN